ncbi:MAG TPA: DUF1553 domain-containing protein [Chthonomonadaceae bacterium]|nr:DUF1553 domain-containing protein [Chthonomonadaceae bacterium]
MRKFSLSAFTGWGVLVCLASVIERSTAQQPSPDALVTKVQPILKRCQNCHEGPNPYGRLNLGSRAAALKGGDFGPALTPGKPETSLLYRKVAEKKMPPANPLTADEIEVVRQWIAAGAKWPNAAEGGKPQRAGLDWWSLQKPVLPQVPKGKQSAWVRNPIDAFVLADLEKRGLSPAPPADRATLMRRVTFDLLGIPPTPQEIAAFQSDPHPDAYERLVDRLLADPRYGERWGRHWLDVARYSESQGFERDIIRDHAWRYRDYVIESFNADKPYTQFIKEQLAGDVLAPITEQGIVATGFLVSGPYDEAGNSAASPTLRLQIREEELEDMLSAVGQTFLGMTVNCARCHDHKFDPIPQKDYYRLKAVFDGVRQGDRSILTPDEVAAQSAELQKLKDQIAAKGSALAALERTGSERVRTANKPPDASAVPRPMALWTFETDAKESLSGLQGTLNGGARIAHGRLILNGDGAYMQTAPLSRALQEKTLEAWVALPDLAQHGGGVITLLGPDQVVFDAIVYGEREPAKWIAGSNNFVRTLDLNAPRETAHPDQLIHMAVVYRADNSITVYRNGVPYAPTYIPKNQDLHTFASGSTVLFGLRHFGAVSGFLKGEIEEARLYDRALTPTEVAASFHAGVSRVPIEQILRALTPEERTQHQALQADLERLQTTLDATAQHPLAHAANSLQPNPTFVLVRGDVNTQGEKVTAGGLSAVKTLAPDFGLSADAPEGQRRLKLAEWIANPDNPLTARVMVNRVWHYHFGRGIVGTPNDFGYNGEHPTNPALLDWLATTFIEKGWRLKALHRLILLSNTYRQSARYDAKAAAMDAEDRLLWRFPPQRLEGEAIRDAMLCISGQINWKRGGPSFRPFTEVVNNSHFYIPSEAPDPEFNRRAVYRINVNSAKSALLEALDCPDPSTKTPRRTVTTTPLQALELMNNTFVLRQAHGFGERVRREAGTDASAQVGLAYRLAFGRPPTSEEAARAARVVRSDGLDNFCWALFNASEFLYVR